MRQEKNIKILGLASATNTIGAALVIDGVMAAESTITGDRVRSEKLISLANDAISRSGLEAKDLDAVAVATGPGSYSGLRGGIATAKGLAAALDIPIISVPTLDAAAYNFIDHSGTVLVAINACKDDYNTALFGFNGGSMKRLTDDMTLKLSRLSEVVSKITGVLTVACDRDISGSIKKENIFLASSRSATPRAGNVAMLGLAKYRRKEFSDALTLVPVYSHKPNIREFKK